MLLKAFNYIKIKHRRYVFFRRQRLPSKFCFMSEMPAWQLVFSAFFLSFVGFFFIFDRDDSQQRGSDIVSLTWSACGSSPHVSCVIDGDTIVMNGERIRLAGIDAPENDQTCTEAAGRQYACGKASAAFLRDLLTKGNVSCQSTGKDRYGRTLGVCEVGSLEINREMVRAGWALAYRHYSDRYVDDEDTARIAHNGMWRGTFQPPWGWRHRNEHVEIGDSPKGCRIKGNISMKGERIYHVPGGEFYDGTQIHESKGERWFCSESEAQAAGWRRSRR
jgi:endonuclease YncB( thermonuclease family)